MEDKQVRRLNPLVEALIILLILLQAYSVFIGGLRYLPMLFIEIAVYCLLTLIFYYALTPRVILAEPKVPLKFDKIELSKEETDGYLQKIYNWMGLLKLSVIFLLSAVIVQEVFGLERRFHYLVPLLFVFYMASMFFSIYKLSYYMMLVKGYTNITRRDVLTKALFYYNPDDKRAFVDKPFGAGTTINFASKQGRMIFAVILSVPLTIILILVIVLMLK